MSNLMMPSRILLYGRKMKGISIDVSVFDAGTGGIPGLGSNRFLREQFDPSEIGNHAACFAMIYGFEFEAHYYDLMAPTIMLVHGEGMEQDRGRKVVAATAAAAAATNATRDSVVAAAFAATDGAGAAEIAAAVAAEAAAQEECTAADVAAAAAEAAAAAPYIGRVEEPFLGFADNVRIWPYDKADFSLRLDPCSGPLESILVEAEFDDSEMAAETSGRQVSGRQVSGRQVSGRQVSGRQVRGKK
jgi:hypothetical protein